MSDGEYPIIKDNETITRSEYGEFIEAKEKYQCQ